MLNQYVKIKGYPNWFMLLTHDINLPEGFTERMRTQMFRSRLCQLHNNTPEAQQGFQYQAIMRAVEGIDYESLANKYGSLLIQEVGSFMPLLGSEIKDIRYETHFPIEDFADIVICENDERCEYKWNSYLQERFPTNTITTINYFDLRSDEEVKAYFQKAKIITFSTTFSDFDWFRKLATHAGNKQIIGFCSDNSKWEIAKSIHNDIEIVAPIIDSINGRKTIPPYRK